LTVHGRKRFGTPVRTASSSARCCVIGAGPCGITAAKNRVLPADMRRSALRGRDTGEAGAPEPARRPLAGRTGRLRRSRRGPVVSGPGEGGCVVPRHPVRGGHLELLVVT